MIKKLLEHKLKIVIAAILLIGLFFFLHKNSTPKITYDENKASLGSITLKVLAVGTVQPQNRLEIKPPIPGRIEKILIEEGQYVKKGQMLAWMSSNERSALLDAASAKGEAELKRWQDIYRPTPIIAPINGTIILKNVEQGEVFASTDALMVMSDRLTVKAQIDETDIASIKLKQKCEIILDAYSDKPVPATVDKIAFEATTVNNVTTYIVDVLPDAVPDFMKSGMTANVNCVVDVKENILLIPSSTLKTKDGKVTTLILDDGDQIEKPITTGITDGKNVEVTSGLSEGEIVLSPQINIQNQNSSSPFVPSRKNSKPKENK